MDRRDDHETVLSAGASQRLPRYRGGGEERRSNRSDVQEHLTWGTNLVLKMENVQVLSQSGTPKKIDPRIRSSGA